MSILSVELFTQKRALVKEKNDLTVFGEVVMVDVNGLEPLTTRTSSECSTN